MGMLGGADQNALLSKGVIRRFPAGETLIHEGDRRDEVYLLVSGFVKIFGNTYDGRQVLLSIRTTGDLIGELAALDGEPRSATVTAATKTETRMFASDTFRAFLDAHQTTAQAVQRYVTRKLRLATRHRIDVGGASVLVRLARVLDRLAASHGRRTEGGIRIEVPLSQVELAALVGAAEPSVHRALSELRQRGIVVTGYRHIMIVDSAGLTDAAQEAPESIG
ncbi:Crp/Fnr family transcriptional regulator [Acrocarpospora corrugata]|uniref:Crp/Fnr family transcriptional regulator n=2 Tax=Acrocarpospora corrugata TaxID=35763 RepID=A0A5M3VSG3_9ACTN|nr:Crp/Fnr family transcriptional regulator [Acrocarpospora corrugata]